MPIRDWGAQWGSIMTFSKKNRYLKNIGKVFYLTENNFQSQKLFEFWKNIAQNPNYGVSNVGDGQTLLLTVKFFKNGSENIKKFKPQKLQNTLKLSYWTFYSGYGLFIAAI